MISNQDRVHIESIPSTLALLPSSTSRGNLPVSRGGLIPPPTTTLTPTQPTPPSRRREVLSTFLNLTSATIRDGHLGGGVYSAHLESAYHTFRDVKRAKVIAQYLHDFLISAQSEKSACIFLPDIWTETSYHQATQIMAHFKAISTHAITCISRKYSPETFAMLKKDPQYLSDHFDVILIITASSLVQFCLDILQSQPCLTTLPMVIECPGVEGPKLQQLFGHMCHQVLIIPASTSSLSTAS